MSSAWDARLARRAARIFPSLRFDFDSLPAHPDAISLAGGVPPVECLPIERLAAATRQVWAEAEPATFAYDETQGHRPLRELIASRMRRRGADVDPDTIVVTAGAQQGIDLIARLLLDPGDRVVIEAPGYFGAFQVFDHYEADIVPVPIDEQGLLPAALERALATPPRPKFIYTVATFQNPTGVTGGAARRQEILALAARFDVPIVEDDPYGELWFEADPGPLRALDPHVIYLGTFSKTLAPALRMGWIAAPAALMRLLIDAKEAVDIQGDRLVQRAVVRACADSWFDAHLDAARRVYRARWETLQALLERYMPDGVRWTRPCGGFFAWVTLPAGLDARELLSAAAAAGVIYLPGSVFYPDLRPSASLRIGFSTLPEERLAAAIERLGGVIAAALTTGTRSGP
ncbi:MAG: PLP-dependent aminotransferase family protein [Sphaerobacter sp.]|nr:PLP-dependent aminotransferase family protein [Sphaerobacter sp.]